MYKITPKRGSNLHKQCQMNEQKVSAALSTNDLEDIMDAIAIIREKLPFLSGLTPNERQQLVKIGRKSQTFVSQALDVAETHSDLMPRCLDTTEARRDLDLFEALNPILLNLSQLYKLVEDTQMLAGSEAYAAARMAYSSIKANGQGNGLDDVIESLSRLFKRPGVNPPPRIRAQGERSQGVRLAYNQGDSLSVKPQMMIV